VQGDAVKIIARANIRLADEYDAAQARGESLAHIRSLLNESK
jgi:hypothetical protein